MTIPILLGLALLAAAGCGGDDEPGAPSATEAKPGPRGFLSLRQVASGFDQPLYMAQAPGSDDLYVVEQPGRVVKLDGDRPGETLVDIRDRVLSGGEQGLLGLAFHPGYADNGRFFLHYTNKQGDTRVEEYRARDGRAEPSPRRELLRVEQPFPNHNGGQLSFGPDRRLYLGLGDGGGAGDGDNHAQDLNDRLGKILRLDPDEPRSDWEPVAYGLRNPWRFSWDRETGSVWIGDVGQDEREEIDVVSELGDPPPNFGWPGFEGTNDIDEREPSGPGRVIEPAAEYTHEDGCSVTGGYVYRGREVPALRGRYVYGDVCSGKIWTLRAGRDSASDVRAEDDELEQVASFAEDARGELYAIALTGGIFRVNASE
ncbi:MAG TPA: PQQ-dependent sugar dehydrogenase [Thermoleophilaceae bacterium]|jgi:glucose/arabinose dehydrogenase